MKKQVPGQQGAMSAPLPVPSNGSLTFEPTEDALNLLTQTWSKRYINCGHLCMKY